MNHFGHGVLSWKGCLSFLGAAGTPHLLLALQGLLSQLRVRRKRVSRHYRASRALCTHPATMQGPQHPQHHLMLLLQGKCPQHKRDTQPPPELS